MTSRVKKWFGEKGFGFITNPDGGKDIFVHYSEIIRPPNARGAIHLNEGQEVTFDCVPNGEKGMKASRVYAGN
jgi:CspA family cold shock protein